MSIPKTSRKGTEKHGQVLLQVAINEGEKAEEGKLLEVMEITEFILQLREENGASREMQWKKKQ